MRCLNCLKNLLKKPCSFFWPRKNPDYCPPSRPDAQGDLKKAKMFLNLDAEDGQTDWIKRRHWLLKNMVALIKKDALGATTALNISRKLSASPDLMEDTLDILKTFFRDLIVFQWTPQKIVNLDFSDAYVDINQKEDPGIFHQWLSALVETEIRLGSNSSLRLSLDRFFLNLAFNKGY